MAILVQSCWHYYFLDEYIYLHKFSSVLEYFVSWSLEVRVQLCVTQLSSVYTAKIQKNITAYFHPVSYDITIYTHQSCEDSHTSSSAHGAGMSGPAASPCCNARHLTCYTAECWLRCESPVIGCKLGSCPIYLHVKNNNIDWSRPPVESLARSTGGQKPAAGSMSAWHTRYLWNVPKITHLRICSSVKPADPKFDDKI